MLEIQLTGFINWIGYQRGKEKKLLWTTPRFFFALKQLVEGGTISRNG